MPSTHSTVSSGARSGPTTNRLSAKGTRKYRRLTPARNMIEPANTMPAVLAGADTSRTSSRVPTAHITTAPAATPSGSDEPSNIGAKPSIRQATTRASRNPRRRATPPRYGMGSAWTARSVTGASTPSRRATTLQIGVSTKVPTTATTKTMT